MHTARWASLHAISGVTTAIILKLSISLFSNGLGYSRMVFSFKNTASFGWGGNA
jgi:hypothetical protein